MKEQSGKLLDRISVDLSKMVQSDKGILLEHLQKCAAPPLPLESYRVENKK